MTVVWGGTIFLSAFLLFLVQPIMGKMILPMLGGSPSVWNTCMLFYQTTLLAGYGYVHLLSSRVNPQRQLLVHLVLLAVPLFSMPIGLPAGWTPPDEGNPVLWVLLVLAVAIGLPFFVLSTTAPLLQKWFSWTNHRSARDPYFLYAASNAGSMLALLGYPLLIEPWFPLKGEQWVTQARLWSVGYGLLVVLIALCAWLVGQAHSATSVGPLAFIESRAVQSLSLLPTIAVVRWTVLAFIPSSLLLGTTMHVTLNVAAIPLLWVIPLALYLLSFILVFARWPAANHRALVIALPAVVLLMVFDAMPAVPSLPHWLRFLIPLVGLAVVALVCHGELVRTRPPTDRLTLFYLMMSVGGALGGLFNALVAPLVFNDIYEYEIVLVLAALVIPCLDESDPLRIVRWAPYRWWQGANQGYEWAWIAALAILTCLALWIVVPQRDDPTVFTYLCAAAPLLLCLLFIGRKIRFAVGLSAVIITAHLFSSMRSDEVLYQTRTFFGVLKVEYAKALKTHTLVHGTINHGTQRMEPDHRRDSVTYFHPTAPYGQVFAAFSGPNAKKRIAVTGLGVAAIANYCDAGQSLRYYEIDPAVVTIAQTPRFFTYYEDARGRGVELDVVVGDARLKMEDARANWYDMIILDAFTSDAIPVHLLTKEAIEMYLRKLMADGLLVVHISNRFLQLEPVLGNMADALGLVALKQFDFAEGVPFKSGSDLVVMARTREGLGPLATDPRWTTLRRSRAVGIWSDDFSNVLSIFRWGD
jgi:hypothetical protein